jgi:hypothetical protein
MEGIIMSNDSLKEAALRSLAYLKEGVDGREVMAFGISVQGLYYERFGASFPKGYKGKGKDMIATMCRCIIDGKPYDPEQVTG